jgi:predicted negative regulator of RcsB-dependent stress response
MSDEYDSSSVDSNNVYYSPFWPLAIVLAGFIIWLGYQIFTLNQQRSYANSQVEALTPTVQQAQMAQNRLISLLRDLAQTSSKDQYAAQILKEAVDAGLLHVTPNANTNAAPATTTSNS